MAKNKKLTELTINELFAKKRKYKSILTALGIIMLIACITITILATISKKYALIPIGIICFINLLPVMIQIKKVEEEIKSRTENKSPTNE